MMSPSQVSSRLRDVLKSHHYTMSALDDCIALLGEENRGAIIEMIDLAKPFRAMGPGSAGWDRDTFARHSKYCDAVKKLCGFTGEKYREETYLIGDIEITLSYRSYISGFEDNRLTASYQDQRDRHHYDERRLVAVFMAECTKAGATPTGTERDAWAFLAQTKGRGTLWATLPRVQAIAIDG